MKRASAGITPTELNLILETVEAMSPRLRTKDSVALTRGVIKKLGTSPKMERLVHRMSDRFKHIDEGEIRNAASKWFTLEKRGPEQRRILDKLDAMDRRARGSVLETLVAG